MTNLQQQKQQLRSRIRELKHQQSAEQLASWSRLVLSRVEELDEFRRAEVVLAYYSLPFEPCTHQALLRWSVSKQILLPTVVAGQTGEPTMELHVYQGPDRLERGELGTIESRGALYPPMLYDRIDLAIVPGIAFDRLGNRMGRGRGFYDNLLPKLRATRVGVCFPFQLVSRCPVEATDIPMDLVVSAEISR